MRTPVVLVTGVDADATASTLVSLAWDLPRAVSVRHEIDPERQVLTRTVSDAGGLLEREEIELEHACTNCALREDVVPTIERLARDGRWEVVVACLPVGAEADRVCDAVADEPRLHRHVRIAAVVVALTGGSVVDDLLGDDLLRERGRHSGPDDSRGLGEVGCAMVEHADTIVLCGAADATSRDLVAALARPGARIVDGGEHLDASTLVAGTFEHAAAVSWATAVFQEDVPALGCSRVWRLDLASPRPFHPGRLMSDIAALGGGRHRSRGAFWLPSRPGVVQEWDGSGGQLSIGAGEPWGPRVPRTRLLLTGVGAEPMHLRAAFEALLLTPEEGLFATWGTAEDGFEPWLGPIRDVA